MSQQKTLIIGLSGKARSGKDTIASHLHYWNCKDSKIYSFASDLKAFCRVMGFMQQKDGNLLQQVGTHLYRNLVDKDKWINGVMWQIKDDKLKIAIIPDVRFENELLFIEDNGGIVFRIDRINEDGTTYLTTDRNPNDESETELDNYPFKHRFTVKSGDMEGLGNVASQIDNLIKQELS